MVKLFMIINENLDKLCLELIAIAEEIGQMKNIECDMVPGPAKDQLKRLIRQKQYQALFYMDKIENLSNDKRKNTKKQFKI